MSESNWVLLRGLSRGRFHWRDFPQRLQSELSLDQVICPELPGNGELFKKTTPSKIDLAVEQLRNQLSTEIQKNGYTLFSISLGAMIAKHWSELYPDEVKKLVLINTSFKNLSPFYQRMQPNSLFEILRSLWISDFEVKEQIILDRTSNNKEVQRQILKEYAAYHKQHPVSYKSLLNQLLISQQARFKDKPHCPTLLLVSRYDHLVSYKCMEKVANKFDLPLIYNTTAGHDLTLDDPNWVIDQLKKIF